MRKLIHKLFEMNLSSTLLERVEENSYFSDNFFAKITYPFEKNVDELDPQFIYHYNRSNYTKLYTDCLWNEWGKIEEAKLYVLSSEGSKKSFQIVTGFDNFPNFDKKLSELPLHKFKLDSDIYEHAEMIVAKKYPEVDYNFPAVHTNMINTDRYLFAEFKGTYNLYKNGAFVRNQIDASNKNRVINYNIMNPAVYLLYLLKAGFADAGYSLEGDVLESNLLQNILVFKGNSFSNVNYPEAMEWEIARRDYDKKEIIGIYPNVYKYIKECENNIHGIFKVSGSFDFDRNTPVGGDGDFYFKYGDQILRIIKGSKGHFSFEFYYFNKPDSKNILTLEGQLTAHPADLDRNLMRASIIPVTIFNEDDTVLNPNLDSPEIDLGKFVPEMTFGELIKGLKNTFNLDLFRKGKVIHMNFIESNVKDYSNIRDLSQYEVSEPVITFNDAISFLLKFQYEDEQFPFDFLYVDKSGAKTSGFEQPENTNEVNSPVIPLPVIFRNNINSAKYLTDDSSYLSLVIYSGLVNGKNEAQSNSSLLWPQLYTAFWKEWLEFRFSSDSFKWEFSAFKEKIKDLDVKTKIHAYNRTHIIKKITRSDLSENTEHIELETYSE